MNYKRIYDNLMNKAKERGKVDGEYMERHHIIPDFMFYNRKRKGPRGHLSGNANDVDNLVYLYPREHYIAHLLLYEMYKGKRYGVQCGTSLAFFAKVKSTHQRQKHWQINSRQYDIARRIGLESISKARKGKMPAIDAITREPVGSVPVDHPLVLSGQWIHQTSGRLSVRDTKTNQTVRVTVEEYNANKHLYSMLVERAGDSNGNFKHLSDEIRETMLKELITLSYIQGSTHYFFTKDITNYFRENAKRFNFKTLSIQFINSKFGSVESLVDAVGEYHSVNCKCLGKGYHLIRRYNLQRYGHELRNEIYDFFE